MKSVSRRAILKFLGLGALGVAQTLTAVKPWYLIRAGKEAELLHHIHPDHVIGDVHPFYYEGLWYLFYLGPGFQSRLITSSDLLRWTEVELTHTPTNADNPELAPYYVLNVFRDPASNVFRTYHGWSGGVMYSHQSTDLIHWDFAQAIYKVPQQSRYSQQRDPYVFWNEAEAMYWCIMTCKVAGYSDEQNGAVGFASSTNLQKWVKRGDLLFPGNIREPEVPQLFSINRKWYLLASILTPLGVGRPSYWISDQPTGSWSDEHALDGRDLSAANVGFDGKRWLLFGWIPLTTVAAHGKYTWGGHLGLPRELHQLDDGVLGTRLEPTVGTLIRGEKQFPSASSSIAARSGTWDFAERITYNDSAGTGLAMLSGSYERIDLEVTLIPEKSNKRMGILLESSAGGVEIALDSYNKRLVISSQTGRDLPQLYTELPIALDTGAYQCRVIAEADVIELFVNDRYSLAARIAYSLSPVNIGLFAWSGTATFRDLVVHRLSNPNAPE